MTRVRLSSAERVIFPDDGITKGDLFAYYADVAGVVVPHLASRPFTMKRFRDGAGGQAFFQKEAPKGMPGWIPTRPFVTHPRRNEERIVHFPLVNEPDALLWMVQMHCIDMNVWLSRVDRPERPDTVVFDLDAPEEEGGFAQAAFVALRLREVLEACELRSYPKTSGAGGVHVVVPITRRSGFDATRQFAVDVTELLQRRHPEAVTTEWSKALRQGVLIDVGQNGPGRTMASVYSVRPKPGAPVSTPLAWDELTEELDWRALGMAQARERIARLGDLHAPVLEGGQGLSGAAKALARLARSEA